MSPTSPESSQIPNYTYDLGFVEYTLDDVQLEFRCHLGNLIQTSGDPSSSSAGRLDVLPLEIVTEILLCLDLPTLAVLRRVSRGSSDLVGSVQQYGRILKQCPNILRAAISINATYFDLRTLYSTMFTSKCESCDLFGDYLYLITCKRVCYLCFISRRHDYRYFPVTPWQAKRYMGLSKRQLEGIPQIFSVAGHYGGRERWMGRRLNLFDRQSVLDRARERNIEPPKGVSQQRDLTEDEPQRFMAIISAPLFNGHIADWGIHCVGCGNEDSESEDPGPEDLGPDDVVLFRQKYTKEGFADHIKEYGELVGEGEEMVHAKRSHLLWSTGGDFKASR